MARRVTPHSGKTYIYCDGRPNGCCLDETLLVASAYHIADRSSLAQYTEGGWEGGIEPATSRVTIWRRRRLTTPTMVVPAGIEPAPPVFQTDAPPFELWNHALSRLRGSNPQPSLYKSAALPFVLRRRDPGAPRGIRTPNLQSLELTPRTNWAIGAWAIGAWSG